MGKTYNEKPIHVDLKVDRNSDKNGQRRVGRLVEYSILSSSNCRSLSWDEIPEDLDKTKILEEK